MNQFDNPLPQFPTAAPPGTEEKIRIMRERLARGEHLHHPGDESGNARWKRFERSLDRIVGKRKEPRRLRRSKAG